MITDDQLAAMNGAATMAAGVPETATEKFLADSVRALLDDRRQHELANGGCVPKPAYDDLAEGIRGEAWATITRLATDHRHCDCTGTFPCEVRRLVDRFGREFCNSPQKAPA